MRRLLDGLITGIALIFIVPTSLILLSWNAIPGEGLYPLKTGLENVTLALLSGTPLLPKASIKFTDRRFNEATVLLARKGSTVGYSLLVANAKQTQTFISQKSDVQSAVQFSQDITTYKTQIQKQKEQIVAQAASSGVTLNNPTPVPFPTATTPPTLAPSFVPAPVAAATPQPVVVTTPVTVVIQQETPQQQLVNLNNTEQELNQIQQEVDSESHGQGNGHGNQNNGQGHGNGND